MKVSMLHLFSIGGDGSSMSLACTVCTHTYTHKHIHVHTYTHIYTCSTTSDGRIEGNRLKASLNWKWFINQFLCYDPIEYTYICLYLLGQMASHLYLITAEAVFVLLYWNNIKCSAVCLS